MCSGSPSHSWVLYLGPPSRCPGLQTCSIASSDLEAQDVHCPSLELWAPRLVLLLFHHLPNSRAHDLGTRAGDPCVGSAEAMARLREGPASLEAQPRTHLIQMFVLVECPDSGPIGFYPPKCSCQSLATWTRGLGPCRRALDLVTGPPQNGGVRGQH